MDELGKKREREGEEQTVGCGSEMVRFWHQYRLYALLCSLGALGPCLQDIVGYSVNRLI